MACEIRDAELHHASFESMHPKQSKSMKRATLNITSRPYLIDGAGDQARHICCSLQGDGEARRKRRCRLHSGETALTYVVRHGEAEDSSCLVIGRQLLNFQHGRVHVLYVVEIGEHEGLRDIKATRDDVLCILISQSRCKSETVYRILSRYSKKVVSQNGFKHALLVSLTSTCFESPAQERYIHHGHCVRKHRCVDKILPMTLFKLHVFE